MTTSENVDVTARVQVIPAPIASPGQCVFCGKNTHPKGFLDPKLDFEFYGTVYYCYDCVTDLAGTFGFISPEDAIKLAQRIKQLEEELALHREALLHLEESVEHLTSYRMLRNISGDTSAPTALSESADETPEITDEAASGTVFEFPTRTNDSESNSDESVSEQGTDDVSVTTGSSTSNSSSIGIIDL